MSYLSVCQSAIDAEKNLLLRLENFNIQVSYEIERLKSIYELNSNGLGHHSTDILDLIDELDKEYQNNACIKRTMRKLKLSIRIRQFHIDNPWGICESNATSVSKDGYLAGVATRIYESGFRKANVPCNNGSIKNNIFMLDKEFVPSKYNPYNRTFGEIMSNLKEKYNTQFEGVPFIDGMADFSGIALAHVDLSDIILAHIQTEYGLEEIPDFSQIPFSSIFSKRDKNILLADHIAAIKQIPIRGLPSGYSADDLTNWREANHFTWDESFLNGYLLVPSEIHNNIPHTGLVGIGGHNEEIELGILKKLLKSAKK